MAGNAPSIRYEWADFLNTGTTNNPVWTLLGRGVTALDESPAAVIDTTAYISDRSASGTVTGYAATFPFTAERIITDKALNYIYDVGLYQQTGADAQTQMLRVRTDEPMQGETDKFHARLFLIAIEVATFSGAGTEKIVCDGNFHQVGDLTIGTYDRLTKVFTPSNITGVTISPNDVTVALGATQTFTATVSGTGSPEQTVRWSVDGAQSTNTRILDNGELTVATDETASALTVRATSAVDPTKKGEALVVIVSTDITAVTVSPPTSNTAPGSTQQFTVTVTGTPTPPQTVTWTVTGGVSASTIISASGLLTVGSDETASTLIVTARSTVDTTKTGTATVTV